MPLAYNLSPVEVRVLGCLVEKEHTTPDYYPLTVNSLRLACNQSTNRDPVVDFGEVEVRQALQSLKERGWVRTTSASAGDRVPKYKHLLPEELDLNKPQLALLAVLMLRGVQTPGELKQRSERIHPFADLAAVHETLEELIVLELAVCLGRRPGQKEDRYEHLMGGGESGSGEAAGVAGGTAEAPAHGDDADNTPDAGVAPAGSPAPDRLAAVEAELLEIKAELAKLRERIGNSGQSNSA